MVVVFREAFKIFLSLEIWLLVMVWFHIQRMRIRLYRLIRHNQWICLPSRNIFIWVEYVRVQKMCIKCAIELRSETYFWGTNPGHSCESISCESGVGGKFRRMAVDDYSELDGRVNTWRFYLKMG